MRAAFAKAQTALMMKMAGVKPSEKERGDHLLEVLGTIIIAVVILILFRGVIINIFTSALSNTESSVTGLFANVNMASPTP